MNEQIKHFSWTYGQGEDFKSGRVAVAVGDDDYLRVKQLAGSAMPSVMLPDLLAAALSEDDLALANELHANRQNPYAVEKRVGMSGCADYMLRTLRDESTNDAPIVARIHVSMYYKLNEPINIWLGDLPPIWAAMAESDEFKVCEDEVESDGSFLWSIDEAPQFEGKFQYSPSESLKMGDFGIEAANRKSEDSTDSTDNKYLSEDTLQRLREIKFTEEEI